MLQSEFFERTHITLTGEEYADVECLYNAVKMDKDEFCAHWKKLNKSDFLWEIAEAMKHYQDSDADSRTYIHELEAKLDAKERQKNEQIQARIEQGEKQIKEFAAKIIRTGCDDPKVYDTIEEECGLDFICKTKLEEGIELKSHEVNHLIRKLV